MTKEEIVTALLDDVEMPYLQDWQARDIVDFVLKKYTEGLPTLKGWVARDDADRLGLYDQKPTRKTELGAFSGIVHPWAIGDTWIGRFSLDQAAKPLFPNLCWTDDPMEVEIMFKPIQEWPEVDLEKEILDWIGDEDSCKNGKWTWYECNKMLRHFYELGLNARKEE